MIEINLTLWIVAKSPKAGVTNEQLGQHVAGTIHPHVLDALKRAGIDPDDIYEYDIEPSVKRIG